jgi:hypothetical protein
MEIHTNDDLPGSSEQVKGATAESAAYPPDDGPLTENQLAAIRELSAQEGYRPTRSLIDGL